jgi:hypothetical protein
MSDKDLRHPPKFKIGDKVTYVNDYGVTFPNRTIVGIDYWDGYPEPRYFMEPSGNPPHYASKESNFRLEVSVDTLNPKKASW